VAAARGPPSPPPSPHPSPHPPKEERERGRGEGGKRLTYLTNPMIQASGRAVRSQSSP